jgi:hypothetical protein
MSTAIANGTAAAISSAGSSRDVTRLRRVAA